MIIHKGILRLVAILFIQTGLFAQVAPDLLLPEDESDNVQWEAVQFNWTMVDTEVVYQVEIADNGAFDSPLYNELIEGNFTEVNELFSNWQFSWRVRAGYESDTADYRFTNWSDVSTFKTVYVVPENIAPFDSTTVEDYGQVQLEWQLDLHPLVNPASSFYSLQVGTDNAFANIIYEESGLSDLTTEVTDLEANSRYFWRVKYYNTFGESDWSETTSFITPAPAPDKVNLLSPENNATGISPANIQFSWERVENADSYNFELATDSQFNKIIESTTLFTSEYSTTINESGNRIFWHVQAGNENGDGEWSDTWSFVTSIIAPQTPPALLSPLDSTSGYSAGNLEFEWRGVQGADSYNIEIAPDIVFTETLTSESSMDTSITLNLDLSENQYYYWRVRAENDSGSGPWSETWTFYAGTITYLNEFAGTEKSFELLQNYPNPFNPTTTIPYRIAEFSTVSLEIYNVLGQHVVTLVNDVREAGFYEVTWDGLNTAGQYSASGIYFYILKAATFNGQKIIKSNKLLKLK